MKQIVEYCARICRIVVVVCRIVVCTLKLYFVLYETELYNLHIQFYKLQLQSTILIFMKKATASGMVRDGLSCIFFRGQAKTKCVFGVNGTIIWC